MAKTLLKNADILMSNGVIEKGDILIDGSIIAAIGIMPSDCKVDKMIDCTDKLAIPGLVNTHTHAAMTLFRSFADDMLLMDWLQQKIWPAEAKLTADDVYWGTMLAIAEMLKSGTTTFADMYFFMPEVAKAVAESGIRAVLARGMAGVAPTAESALVESEAFYNQFHNASDGRIKVMIGPHAPYTCPPDYLKKVVSLAGRLGAEIHIHLSETLDEVKNCEQEYKMSPIKLMDQLGVLDCGVLAAHCVHVTEDDINIMKQKNVRVAHNPGSNMKLASGIAPIPQMLKTGLVIGLGTDGASSNNNLDMLEEIRLVATLHKANTLNPLVVPAGEAVRMATSGGARALGLEKAIGAIEVGLKADIVLMDMSGLHWYPRYDKLSLLAYSAGQGDVDTVIVNGDILVEKRQLTTIDEEQLKFEVQNRGIRLTSLT
ncbi:5-methylthioadenosine/S-adenosylhomocysteine deaminase [bioreactor metagenome]|uniref:5-methylthioadenosine/S-adenosylhomocysteine deaminase n=1 Tax=bioreactor metagenome TaxID=1076179 RepID=A0A644T123_9ZZZZ|nr:amidohydrolase [Negativicutes bacterium]